jgi:nucleoid-associated protein YgaU
VLVCSLALVAWVGARVADAAGTHSFTVQTVRAGDTVWSIVVQRYGVARHDVRDLVDRIERLNDLHNDVLQPGQRIRVPAIE